MTNTPDINCVLERPDIAELADALRAEMSRRLLGGAPVLPLSTEDVLSYVMAGTVNLMFGAVAQAMREYDPETMCCDNLVVYAARHGIDMRGATRAKGYAAITGTPNALIPPNVRFVGESSHEYKLDPGVTFNPSQLDASGGAVLRIVAATYGPEFNVTTGTPLVVSTTTTGIDMDALVVGNGLTGGTNDEDCETLRKRVIAAESAGALVLTEAWYLKKTMTYPGVTRACTDECAGCCDPQFIAIYVFMEGVYGDVTEPDYGVPPCDVLDAMTEWMFGLNPGRGEALAPMGVRGRYQQAWPTVMSVTAQCFQGCATGAEDRMADALWNYIRTMYCVGSTICKDQLRTVIYNALGQQPCMSNVQFHFDDTLRYEDEANAYLDCGRFLVLGDITLTPGWP